jgi:Escherichia/Staphylococcus phage prohead protease
MRRTTAGQLAVREQDPAAPESDGRTIEGIAVPYGVPVTGPTREYGDAAELFERGAFADVIAVGRRIPILDRHDGNVVGMADLEDGEQGLAFRGRLLTSTAARDYAERVAAGADGVSIEFLPGRIRRSSRQVVHTRVRTLAAIAGAYAPAYAGAAASVRAQTTEGTNVDDLEQLETMDEPRVRAIASAVARTAAEQATRELAETITIGAPASPWAAYRSLGELIVAARETAHGDELRRHAAIALAERAWTDQTTPHNPGVLPPTVLADVRGIINPGRPLVSAFGGARSLGDTGMAIDWPYFDGDLATLVGEQATEKTEIVSARVDIKKGTTPIKTYAGGSDVSYQLIRRSSPSYLDAYGRIMLAAYAAVTDKAFATQLLAASGLGSVTADLLTADAAAIMGALFGASVKVQAATGAPADFAVAATDVFVAIAGKLTPLPIVNAIGTANAATLQVNAAGLPVRHDPLLPAGSCIVSNALAAGWHEDGPMLASDEDVAKLGRDVAYWGMGATAVYLPAGVVKIAKSAR